MTDAGDGHECSPRIVIVHSGDTAEIDVSALDGCRQFDNIPSLLSREPEGPKLARTEREDPLGNHLSGPLRQSVECRPGRGERDLLLENDEYERGVARWSCPQGRWTVRS